ncbi:MAG: hypothetical protein IK080_05230 [Clostridia bacterium]|nr:hypothetical protein [Clostridia bacterium]
MKNQLQKNSIRLLACLLSCLLLAGSAAVGAAAVPFSSGLPALQKQWARSEGPEGEGIRLEYSYFTPDTQEACPLFVLLGGAGEGTPSGHELDANDFAYWSSEEFQARVSDAPGMYIMILKAPEPVYFDTCPLTPMFAAVRDFAQTHNVDRKRIYVGGWCIGATGAARLATNHPDFFAGLMLFSPRTLLTEREAQTIRNMKIWIFACKADSYSTFSAYAKPSWENVTAAAADRSLLRYTTCSSAPRAALLINHKTWRLAEQDYSAGVAGDYTNLSTVDGFGRTVQSPTVIQFMTAYKPGEAPPTTAPAEETSTTTEPATTQAETTAVTATTAGTTAPATTTDETKAHASPYVPWAQAEDSGHRLRRNMLLAAVATLAATGTAFVILKILRRKDDQS